MIRELERVVVLLDALPENYQKEAARRLAPLLMRAEEEMTMTEEEKDELEQLRREETQEIWRRMRKFVGKSG